MKCISLHQPWASLCVLPSLSDPDEAVKPYKTRHWPTNYRGMLLIHAAKKWTNQQRDLCFEKPCQFVLERFGMLRFEWMDRSILTMPLGCIVGVVELMECYKVVLYGMQPVGTTMSRTDVDFVLMPTGDALAFGDFSIGRYAWKLANPRMFARPIPYVGRQGFFNVPDSIIATASPAPSIAGGAV